jgi:hypothetical protein
MEAAVSRRSCSFEKELERLYLATPNKFGAVSQHRIEYFPTMFQILL